MTMNFETVKDALVTLLGNSAAGRYRTIGYQDRGTDATEVLDSNRSVQVFYSGGKFPKSGGRVNGPTKHDMNYQIVLTAGGANKVDLSVLDNVASTEGQKAAALAAMAEATEIIETSYNELFALIYQILMDNENKFLGLTTPRIGSRWVEETEKNEPTDRGGYTVITGDMLYSCNVDEPLTGATPTAATPGQAIDLANENQDEEGNLDTGKAGVLEGG